MRTCEQATTARRRAVAEDPFVFPARTRAVGSAAIVAVAAAGTALAPLASDGRYGYVLAHAAAGAPFSAATLGLAAIAARRSTTPALRTFWRRWLAANAVAALATVVALAAAALRSPALVRLNLSLLLVAAPVWGAATHTMVGARRAAARRSTPSTPRPRARPRNPVALLVAEPLRRAEAAVRLAVLLVVPAASTAARSASPAPGPNG